MHFACVLRQQSLTTPWMPRISVKMGLAYTVVAASNLIGNPIAGALLTTSTGGPLTWWRAIVFTGVRLPSPYQVAQCIDTGLFCYTVCSGGGERVHGSIARVVH